MATTKSIERRIKRRQKEIRKSREELAAKKAEEARKRKSLLPVKKGGRPRIPREKMLEIELDAYDRPLMDVALKYGVSVSTLYRYGIKRKILDRKIADSATEKQSLKI